MSDAFSNSQLDARVGGRAAATVSARQTESGQTQPVNSEAPLPSKGSKGTFRDELVQLIPRLRRYAYSLTGSTPDGDDLVQVTLERSMSREHQFKGNSGLQGWVFSVLRSCWSNELRSRKVRSGNGTVDAELLDDTRSDNSPEVMLIRKDLHSLLMQLPENHRNAIMLVDVEGMSYTEAAEALDIPRGTLMSRLARGREKLLASMDVDVQPGTSSETTKHAR
ncbi:MAG: RNA polymerase sigma factor [Granulosicoccus sp.]|nr:RNA polymerase sigma factor [Granulosicoccus sp.]